VTNHNPTFIPIPTLGEARAMIQEIGSDPKSVEIMAPKALMKVIKMSNVELQDAIIIKQDMLSLGGEVAVPKSTFSLQKQTAEILIMGTITQLRELVQKLKRHYSRIQRIANELSTVLQDIE
jgi:dihydropteroate synthase